jgi:glucosylceramidase
MRSILVQTFVLAVGLVGCNGTETPAQPGSGGSPTGGAAQGGSVGQSGGTTSSGGSATGGTVSTTGGQPTGGSATGGKATGGSATGGVATGGNATGGASQAQVITTAPGAEWKTGTVTQVTSGTADVTVNTGTTYQTWTGFGGAFNELGWTYLLTLSQADRDRAMQLLFGTNGCRFAYGRIPIGASDYATDRYTNDEISSGTDYTMASFSINRDQQRLIPFVKAALAVKSDIHLWASPWTPPTWMKSSPFKSGNVVSPFDGGTMKSDAQTLQAFALYLAKWVQAYAGQGLTIQTIMPQNEPNYDQNYPSCLWATDTFNTFIKTYLGPTFASQNITAKIFLGTMSNSTSGEDPAIVTAVTGDSASMQYIKGFGMQWGMETGVSGLVSRNLPIWQTEHKCGNYPWMSGYVSAAAPNDQAYAVESWGLITQWIKDGVHSYSTWNMVLDRVGKGIDTTRDWAQDALLVVNGGQLTITPAYYVFRHISQFVDPGATRIATTGGDALAFRNPDGSIVTIMYNSGAAKTSIVQVGSTRLQFAMPGTGWATVKSP